MKHVTYLSILVNSKYQICNLVFIYLNLIQASLFSSENNVFTTAEIYSRSSEKNFLLWKKKCNKANEGHFIIYDMQQEIYENLYPSW